MIALLANEPWCLPPSEIRKLTPAYIAAVYFRERDEVGRIRVKPVGALPPPTTRQLHDLACEARKQLPWRARALWEARSPSQGTSDQDW